MAIKAQKTQLNVVPGGIIPVMHVSQYDVGRTLTFVLYDGNTSASLATGTTAVIEGTKPDGHGFQYSATISGNEVTVNTTQQMTIITGTVDCKIVLSKGSQVIGTALFIMDVEKAGINESTDISETDLPLIIAEATEQMERAEAAATAAALSETHAATSETNAATSETNAAASETNAATSETNAATSESNAAASASSASTDAASASVSATNANRDALKSEGHAVGQQNGVDVPGDSPYFQNNAKYYAQIAEQYAQGGLIYKGSVLFANIPTTGMSSGDLYNIEDDFTTDSRFQEGAGILVKAGADIAWNGSKWDVLATSGVTGVKGNAESTYRQGNVNLTPANVGAVDLVDYEEDIYGVNLIPYPYNQTTKTASGITFTDNGDGSITVNGTATADVYMTLFSQSGTNFILPKGSYTGSGCPSGGSDSTYQIRFQRIVSSTTYIYKDKGNGVDFEFTEAQQCGVYIFIYSGATLSNVTFKPMLRKAEIKDDTYYPYNPQSIQNQLTEQTNVLGAKNLYQITGTTTTKNGITFTVDKSAGTVTVNGTATAFTDFTCSGRTDVNNPNVLPDGAYIGSGCPKGGSESTYNFRFSTNADSGSQAVFITEYGEGGEFTVKYNNNTANPSNRIQGVIRIQNGTVCNNLVFKPMITLATDPDRTFVPYAMTNRELTEKITAIRDLVYPVGSIYMSVNSTSPQTLFGGTWEQLKDRFLLGAGDTYSNGATGGEATHKLTISEMPSHDHTWNGYWNVTPGGGGTGRNVRSRDYASGDPTDDATNNTGGSQAHNNMPPYLVVYMWKRTA